MEIDEVIKKFRELDLSKYPENRIKDLFNKIGAVACVIVSYHAGKTVMRARVNSNNRRFTNISDLSFKPQEYNKTYQRASTPNNTMFYATAIPDKLEDGELDNMRIIGVTETIPILRDKAKSGIQKISFGKWVVQEDINLIAVVHEESYFKESNFTRELVNAYQGFVEQYDKATIDRSMKFQSFLASEFSKSEIESDYDYMISAIFAENMTNKRFDGILYPSVRSAGKGFNVALKPEAVNKLELAVVGECTLYKNKDQVVLSNDAIVKLKGVQESFELVDQNKDLGVYLDKIGIKSLDELK